MSMKIELDKVSVGYEKATILSDISLSFESGQFYCLLGANGIGKTTLFKSILGFIPVLSGQIRIDGKPIRSISSKALSEYLAYVPQAKDNAYDMDVLEVVVMGRARFIKKFSQPSPNDYAAANDIMDRLKIKKLTRKKYSELSGGEQQIVLIARALVQDAKFIIMDEPASNLDFENQKKVLECLKQLSGHGLGVVLSSHSPDHAIFCDTKVVMIGKDKQIRIGSIEETLTDQNLRAVYGVDIHLISGTAPDGRPLRSCCLVSNTHSDP
ncbi:MAG: ABC transporter ATP-binding protein [Oscillospiraceae bacterium]|nr:ABC transporter ATP-binding protein [Oscillospiraceae bacterium]